MQRADKHRGNTARATTTESGTGEYIQSRYIVDVTEDVMKRRQQRGNNNKGTDEQSGKRKSDTTEKKRKQVEYRGEHTSL